MRPIHADPLFQLAGSLFHASASLGFGIGKIVRNLESKLSHLSCIFPAVPVVEDVNKRFHVMLGQSVEWPAAFLAWLVDAGSFTLPLGMGKLHWPTDFLSLFCIQPCQPCVFLGALNLPLLLCWVFARHPLPLQVGRDHSEASAWACGYLVGFGGSKWSWNEHLKLHWSWVHFQANSHPLYSQACILIPTLSASFVADSQRLTQGVYLKRCQVPPWIATGVHGWKDFRCKGCPFDKLPNIPTSNWETGRWMPLSQVFSAVMVDFRYPDFISQLKKVHSDFQYSGFTSIYSI